MKTSNKVLIAFCAASLLLLAVSFLIALLV
jgi:hypothetical protein